MFILHIYLLNDFSISIETFVNTNNAGQQLSTKSDKVSDNSDSSSNIDSSSSDSDNKDKKKQKVTSKK